MRKKTEGAVGGDASAESVSVLESGIIDERVGDRSGLEAADECRARDGNRCEEI